jgi:hypothetical protein
MPASKLQPALLGGLFIGVLSALPVISIGNCFCCAWVIGGGMVAAYLLQQNQSTPINAGDGAVVGLLAGLFGAVIHLVLSIPIGLMFGPMQADLMQRITSSAGEIPPELRPMIEQMQQNAGFTIVGALFSFVFMVIVGVAFGALGGLLGAMFFKKDGPPPPAPPLPQNPFGGAPFNPPPMPPAPPTA